nr:MAG TPA: antitoxin [Caudoviricetes sp.]
MFSVGASEVRKDWSRIIDSVVREKPAFIKRTRDYMMLCTTDMIYELVSSIKYVANKYVEDDGTITLSMKSLDITANGDTEAAAKSALVGSLIEYAEEFYEEFELYSKAPNRRSHLPYVVKALTAKTPKDLEAAVVCQDGEN